MDYRDALNVTELDSAHGRVVVVTVIKKQIDVEQLAELLQVMVSEVIKHRPERLLVNLSEIEQVPDYGADFVRLVATPVQGILRRVGSITVGAVIPQSRKETFVQMNIHRTCYLAHSVQDAMSAIDQWVTNEKNDWLRPKPST